MCKNVCIGIMIFRITMIINMSDSVICLINMSDTVICAGWLHFSKVTAMW